MRVAKIYKPAKTAMQSGRGKTKSWVLEHPRASKVTPEPLMGWQASADTTRQVRLYFDSSDAAIVYCKAHNIAYELVKPNQRKLQMKHKRSFRHHNIELYIVCSQCCDVQ